MSAFKIMVTGSGDRKLVSAEILKPMDFPAAVEEMKRLRKVRILGGLSIQEMIEEGRRF